MDAEKAIQNMSQIKFKENFQLNYSWFDEKLAKSAEKKSLNNTSIEPKSENLGNNREVSRNSSLVLSLFYLLFYSILILIYL